MRRLAARLGWCLMVAWAAVSITFVINELLPGDPARMVAGLQARAVDVARIRDQLGLGRPPLVRYALFWRRLLHVAPATPLGGAPDPAHATCAPLISVGAASLHIDLGKSFQMGQPIVTVVRTRFPRTLALALAGVSMQLFLGVLTGTWAALRQGSWVDRLVVGTTLLGLSAPTFLIALVLQTVLARELRLLPMDGFGATATDHARSIVLPALTLGVYGAAYYTRLVRDEMSCILRRDWMRTARAKGAPPLRLVFAHGLRNALVPVITAAAVGFGELMGGAVITETVFRWPGLGALAVRAALDHDGPVLTACVVVSAVAVALANLLADLSYAALDPRVTAQPGRGNRPR